jgi:hypothetical protein
LCGAGLVVASPSCGDGDAPKSPTLDAGPAAVGPIDLGDARGAPEAGPAQEAATPSLGEGALCEDAGLACGPGLGCCVPCCLAGPPAVCTKLVTVVGKTGCPLPDLEIDAPGVVATVREQTIEAGICEVQEECLANFGNRKVLRFDVRVRNTGITDLVLGNPDASADFVYSPCHAHYHFNGFASYRLLDDAGTSVVEGRKQAFCARDSERFDLNALPQPYYDCVYQGISVGWDDDYPGSLPCQWVDVTGITPGRYTLEIEANPERRMTELRYDNNIVRVPVDVAP